MEKTKIHIAMADDHALFRYGLINLMKSSDNIKVHFEVDNGMQLVEKMKTVKKLPDICVIDINMPEMNGYETTKYIKEEWPDVKVLVLSVHNNEFAIIKLLKEGANGFLSKNCGYLEFYKAINDIYTTGFYYSEVISGRLIHMIQNKDKQLVPMLTDKELEFLSLSYTNLTYKEIAKILCVSPRTVDKYSRVLFEKLNVNTRTALAAFAYKIGLGSNHFEKNQQSIS